VKPTAKVSEQRERRKDILGGKEKLDLEVVHVASIKYVVN